MIKSLILTILISQLGSRDFRTRENAHAKLTKLLPAAGEVLFAGKSHADPEIAVRCYKLHDAWAWEAADRWKVPGWPYLPWIDSWPQSDPDRYYHIQDALGAVVDGHIQQSPEWLRYRQATKIWLYQELRKGTPSEKINAIFVEMVNYEADWIVQHKDSCRFPSALLKAAQTWIESRKKNAR